MGALVKVIDVILFLFFIVIALAAPLLDAQTCLPKSLFPDFLVELNSWYAHEFGDYLVADKPHFFVGLVWFELFFQWPLALLNLCGILGAKPWLNTTCLIYGASVLTSLLKRSKTNSLLKQIGRPIYRSCSYCKRMLIFESLYFLRWKRLYRQTGNWPSTLKTGAWNIYESIQSPFHLFLISLLIPKLL